MRSETRDTRHGLVPSFWCRLPESPSTAALPSGHVSPTLRVRTGDMGYRCAGTWVTLDTWEVADVGGSCAVVCGVG